MTFDKSRLDVGHQDAPPVTTFRWWPQTFVVLALETWLGISLWFAPGWANGWPLPMHTVWSCGMSVVVSVMLMTLTVGIGAAICSVLVKRVEPVRTWLLYGAWLSACAITVGILGSLLYCDLLATG